MADRRYYQSSIGNRTDNSWGRSNYDNRSYSRTDRGNFIDHGKDNSRRNYPFDRDQGFTRYQNDKFSFTQRRNYSDRNEKPSYLNNISEQYSTEDNSRHRYRSNNKSYDSSSSNSNVYEERSCSQDEVDKFSHSVIERRVYYRDKEENNYYSNKSRQHSTQDHYGYGSIQQTYCSPSSNTKMNEDFHDQVEDFSYSVRQSRGYYQDNYPNSNIQYSTQDNFGFESNLKTHNYSDSGVYKERPFNENEGEYVPNPLKQSKDYYQDKDEDNYPNSNRQYSTQDNFGFESNLKTHSYSDSDVYKEQPFYENLAEDIPNSQRILEGVTYNDRKRDSNRGSQEVHKGFSQRPEFSLLLGNPGRDDIQSLQSIECGTTFGHLKRDTQNYNEMFSDGNTFKEFKRDQNDEEYNLERTQSYNTHLIDKDPADCKNEIKVDEDGCNDDDDYGGCNNDDDDDYGGHNDDDYDGCNDDDNGGYEDEEMCNKEKAFIPSIELVEKYKYFPPSAEEMGKIFNGLVIYFFFKTRDVLEKNPFVVICESFRRSDRFKSLNVQDAYKGGQKTTKYCTLTYHDMILVRGVGYNQKFKEPRVVAGVELINKLAMSCYSLKMKKSHYGKDALDDFLSGKVKSSVIRVVPPEEAQDMKSAQNYILNFFKDDNDCELLFKGFPYIPQLKNWAKHKKFVVRYILKLNALGISLGRTPQCWRDKILASGKMENDRFILIPPQGYGKELMKNPMFSMYQSGDPTTRGPTTAYADKNKGLNISTVTPPWVKRGGRISKNNKQNFKKINEAFKKGDTNLLNKKLRHLNKKNKRKIKQRLGLK